MVQNETFQHMDYKTAPSVTGNPGDKDTSLGVNQ